jgi:cell division protein FtsI (penicillin-binding protein 3)
VADEQGSSFRFPWRRARAAAPRRAPASAPDAWRDVIRARLAVGAVAIALWTAGIEGRLVYLQVFQHSEMMARAASQQLRTIDAPAKRGDIVDRNGHVLAYSVDADSIFADPSEIRDPDRTAALVCGALDHCTAADLQSIAKKLRSTGRFVYITRKVTPDEERRVRALELEGLGFLKESRRFYPKRELLAHTLGYVGLDNVGLGGLEFTFDGQIRGREGKVLINIDARKRVLASRIERPATAGAALELTIDQYLQNIAERELRVGVADNNAAGGTALVMDPSNGEILALANWPTFNPNAYTKSAPPARRNRAIQDLYEPGSTFKVVTASAALEERLVATEDPIDCAPGYIRFGGRVISDVHRYGVLPFTDVIVKSSNVGAIKVGLRLGSERLGEYVKRFGFGQTISADFAGESSGIVWDPAQLDHSALASVAMGYQVGVTSLQMAAAVSSVANGGTLFEPRIVRAFIKNGERVEVAPKILRRTISGRTAAELTAIMEAVVERGTAQGARIDGYTVAGKTGTAQKLVDGVYSKSEYNASFVGFVPSREPALVIIVIIDSPHGRGYYGGTVAAPVFRRIAEASLRHLGIRRTINPVPPVLVARHGGSSGARVLPVRAALLDRVLEPARAGIMPDLRGLSAREALRTLTLAGLTARISGQGVVVDQLPPVGSAILPGDVSILKLGRQPPPTTAAGAVQ